MDSNWRMKTISKFEKLEKMLSESEEKSKKEKWIVSGLLDYEEEEKETETKSDLFAEYQVTIRDKAWWKM